MFGWLRDNAKAAPAAPVAPPAPAAPVKAVVAAAPAAPADEVQQALDQMNLLFAGTPSVKSENPAEAEFESKFNTWAANCRAAFSEPGFDLPTLPASAVRVMSLLQNPETSSREIARALQLDVVLTAKFLRMANSPIYGGNLRVDSVQVAIDRLGMVTVKGVVLAISLNSTMIKEKRLGEAANELWTHSISTGLAAQELAKRLKLNAPSAFTLGLMHDIGKIPTLIMVNKLRTNYPTVRPAIFETLVEENHGEVGAILAEVWGMPHEVRLISGGHHAVRSLEETMIYIKRVRPETSENECRSLSKLLGCVVLADRSLAALGLAREPGDLTVGESGFAADLGLTVKETMDYLQKLPDIIKDSTLKDL